MARVSTSFRKAYVLAAGCFVLAIVGAILIAQEFDGLGGASVLYLSAMGEIKDPPKPKAYPKTYLSAMGIIPVEMGAKLTKPLEPPTSDISAGANSKAAAPQPLSEVDSDEIDHVDPDETRLDSSISAYAHMDHIRMGKQSDKSTDDLLHDDDAIPSLSSLSGNKRESGGDAAHERIPDDTGVAPSKTLDANTVALHEGLQKAAHWDSRSFSTKLPQDRSSSSVHDQSESDRWNDAGGYEQNKASALRVKSFWSALHDCRQKNTCQELLGRKLWRVVQSKKGQYNLHIFHDDDTARRGVERQMERDFLNAKPVDDIRKIAKDASIKSWDKLKKMMAKDRKYLPQEPKLSAPPSTRMSRHAHLEHVSLRKSEVMARAKLLDRGYAAETDEIYAEPSKKRAHSYKASMVPQKSDDKEEITDSMGFAATHLTEAHVMRETAAKARAGVAKEVKERGELSKLTSTERKMRDEDTDGQAADKALEDGLKEHEEEDVREEQKVSEEAQKELQGFDVPFRHSARQAPAKPNLRAVKKIAPVQHVWRAQAVPGGKGTLALEAKCWQTGEGCGKLMQGLSSHKAQQLRAVAGLDRPAPQLQGRTGLSKLSHNLGSVLGW